ncbi:histidine phosphatase family protein [Sneathiella sp.]|uniref:SixA phosphatase family protein n=1 Tax=Sneathiella sp. TaxID=1964365 RepID=UPI003564489F
MRKLTLLRHAKSSWSDSAKADIDRPLAPRGHRAALEIGDYMERHRIFPDFILCSPARRTRETLAQIRSFLTSGTEIKVEPSVYSAGLGSGLIAYLRGLSPDYAHVMIIGHNPTMQHMALDLAAPKPDNGYSEMGRKFPSAGLAHIEFDIDGWRSLADRGQLVHFVTPKRLEAKKRA